MGLYEAELNKQLLLRNKQRKEWDMMKQRIDADKERKNKELSDQQRLLQNEKREEDRVEMAETDASKRLVNVMVRTAQEDDDDDTLVKIVDVLKDQNGNYHD